MFMDVRGFTPISEALTATELVDFINMLLAPLSDAIQDELGTIDKYIGEFDHGVLERAGERSGSCDPGLPRRAQDA